jgi:hypothetical protein
MRVLHKIYKHYTECLFPKLAIQYGWGVIHDQEIKRRICVAVGVKVPGQPNRKTASTADFKKILDLCQKIRDNPLIFLFL